VVRFGCVALIVIEIKTGDAEAADTAKHTGYSRWIEKQEHQHKHSVLLTVSATDDLYQGFRFLAWQNVCIEMRRLAIEFVKQGRTAAAGLVLAFVAAVEQNLLGFSSEQVRRICEERADFFKPQVVEHMARFLDA
jgi:hypothetical protein